MTAGDRIDNLLWLRDNRHSVSTRINVLRAIRSPLTPLIHLSIIALLAALAATPAGATTYELGDDSSPVLGEITHYTTKYEDTFTDIARRYSLGWEELIRVNPGIDPWLPGAGQDLVIPTQRILPSGPHKGIVINLPEHRLYYFPKPKRGQKPVVVTYAVSIAKMDWHTPLGETRIVSKQKNPNWYPPESVRKEHAARGDPLPAVVRPGPDNPLGAYKMRLAITPGAYLIHGTNNPLAVGMAVTHGCMRMYPEDIAALYPLVRVGTKVRIVNEPVKVAFVDGELLLEVHPPIDAEGQTIEPDLELFSSMLDQALGSTTTAVHWDLAREIMKAANGLPTVVGLEADLNPPETSPASPEVQTAEGGADPSSAPTTASAAEPTNASIAASDRPAAPSMPATVELPAVTSLPAPALPPADTSVVSTASGARTFPAGDPAVSTAHPLPPAADSPGTAVATAGGNP